MPPLTLASPFVATELQKEPPLESIIPASCLAILQQLVSNNSLLQAKIVELESNCERFKKELSHISRVTDRLQLQVTHLESLNPGQIYSRKWVNC